MAGDVEPERAPALAGEKHADVAVVGGGMAGLSAAQRLREAGATVALLEKDICGAGATGKSSGFITPDSELQPAALVSRFGEERAKHLWTFPVRGVEMIRANIKRFGIPCDYQLQDSLFIANRRNEWGAIEAEHRARGRIGYASTLYPKEKIFAVIGSSDYAGAVRFPDTFGINAYAYCRSMKKELERMGVMIYEGSAVTAVDDQGVKTAVGRVRAGAVVVAADRFTPDLGLLDARVYHAQAFLMASAPLSDRDIGRMFPSGPLMVWDTDMIYQYYRPIGGGRLLLGGGSVLNVYDKKESSNPGRIVRKLERYFRRKFPGVSARWEYVWTGLIGVAQDILPIVGRDTAMRRVYYAVVGAGLPWSAAAGSAVADMITDGRDEYGMFFSPERRFVIPDRVRRIIGAKAAFGLSYLWSEYAAGRAEKS